MSFENGRGGVTTWRAIAALAAFVAVMSGSIAARGDEERPDARAPSWCEGRLLAPFASFLGRGEGRAWDLAGAAEEESLSWSEVESSLGAVEVLVALVPDPIDSTLVYQYDEIVRAVESGVDHTGYLRDQVWLPWGDRHLSDPARRATDEECRVVVPGVRIFRPAARATGGDAGAPRARVVFFVGETPAEGVHKEALRQALKLARELQSDVAPLRIVGPTFSGSARGVADVLRESAPDDAAARDAAPDAGARIRIFSGSATLHSLPAEFAGLRVEFHFTTLDDVTSEQLFFRWLRERDGLDPVADADGLPRLENVGLLVESGTAFGELDECAAGADAGVSGDGGISCPEVVLRFERGVSQLQHAYAQATRATTTASSIPGIPPEDLDPDLDERSIPSEMAASPHPKSLAAADLQLRGLVSQVAREGLRYLAIRATDAGDAIFLANRVRDVAPNVRLIFLGSDVLYLHPHFRDDLRGSYVVSPYPFFGTSDFSSIGSSDVHVHRPWSSQGAEGVFNATVGVFDRTAPEGADARLASLSEYAPFRLADGGGLCAASASLLPLWVTVIGAGALLPIDAIVPERSASDSFYNPCAPPHEGASSAAPVPEPRLMVDEDVTPPHGWRLTLYLLVVVLALHIFASGAPALEGGPAMTLSQGVYRAQYLTYRLARGAVLFAAFAYMVGVHTLSLNAYRWRAEPTDSPWAIGCWPSYLWDALVFACFVGCCWRARDAWGALRDIWTLSRTPGARTERILRLARPLVVPAALSVGVLLLLAVMAWHDRSDFRGGGRVLGVAYTLRALPLGSGASSALVVVLVAGALALWITDRLRRIRLSHLLSSCSSSRRAQELATPIADVVGEDDVKELEAQVQRAIDRSSTNGGSILRSLFIAAVPTLALVVQRPTTVDGRADGIVLVLLVCATTLILLFTLQHMAEFYVAFRRLLRRLRTWRLAATLDHAPGITGTTVMAVLSRNLDDVEPFAACVLVAGDVPEERLDPEVRTGLEAELRRARHERGGAGGLARSELGRKLVGAARDVASPLVRAPLPFPDAEGKPRTEALSPDELAAHRLVGCVTAVLLEIYVRHIRYFVRGVSAPAILLVCVLGTYPFEPHRLFLAGAWILILGLAAISLWAYVGLERDVILSKVSGTRPNDIPINRELVVTVLTVVVLPLLTIFAAQYPNIGRILLRVFDPFSSVLK